MIDMENRRMDWADYQDIMRSTTLPTQPNLRQFQSYRTVRDEANGAGCPTCGWPQNGWLRTEVPVTHRYFGFLVRCPHCQNNERLMDQLRAGTQLTGWLTTATFETYRRTPGNAAALGACREFATLSRRGWLTLWGTYGCGKTHLLAATVNRAVGNKISAAYYTTADLLGKLRATYRQEGASEELETILAAISRVQLLALDEFDLEKFSLTQWVQEQLYRMLDDRYRNYNTRSTLIAMQGEPCIDPANPLSYVYSRMRASTNQVVKITAGDYRPIAATAAQAVGSEKEDPHAD